MLADNSGGGTDRAILLSGHRLLSALVRQNQEYIDLDRLLAISLS
ncbi:UNVERIFIED_ORG: hypothetical protein M2435_003642 [Rhizobium sophorae]|nr:hypothetical protein [Rhizobium leguminosarum]MDH6660728.1 hypothetical protein [Rhizobium sophorae]